MSLIPTVGILSCPLHGLVGAAPGGATGAIVGAVGMAGRRGGVPAGAGRINVAATDEEEAVNQHRHRIWSGEQVAGERRGLIPFVAAPATLCALVETFGATRRVAREAVRQGIRPDARTGV